MRKIIIYVALFAFALSITRSDACVTGPLSINYFKEDYRLIFVYPLPAGVDVKIDPGQYVDITSRDNAYPVYILKDAETTDEVHSRENIEFPKGLEPMAGLVAGHELSYNSSTKKWRDVRQFEGSYIDTPYTTINISYLNFSMSNVSSLDPNFNPEIPKPDHQSLYLYVNSKLYKIDVVKEYTPDPEYRQRVIDSLKFDLERTKKANEAEGSIFKRVFMQIIRLFAPVKLIDNKC